ncbi:MAG TPA: hypothetical protein VJS92_14735, partial [Candidatus Polarisedimenticolaceae bacterium]|nr:hypothetical protein [Candidatus Polarisedimenticolaceae bacterium]
ASFKLRAFDARGRTVPVPAEVQWSTNLAGSVAGERLTTDPAVRFKVGTVSVKAGELQAQARVRVVAPLPWNEDFESIAEGQSPPTWIGAGRKFVVQAKDGSKVLVQPVREQGLQRSETYMGPTALTNYTVEVDVRGHLAGRKKPDIGVINSGYTLDLMGSHHKLQLRCWAAEMGRLSKDLDFPWEMDTWYRVKFKVQTRGGKALVQAKVWPLAATEPADWTIQVEDPHPIERGSPGFIGYAPAEIWYDNLKITGNE